MRGDPLRQLLRPGGLGIGVAGGTEHGDEHLGLTHLAGGGVHDRHRRTAVVDEQLLSGPVKLTHAALLALAPALIMKAELAVAIGAGAVCLRILRPQQLQGDPFALELVVDDGEVRLGELRCWFVLAPEQHRLQLGLVHVRW
jgi:hypothetical protein